MHRSSAALAGVMLTLTACSAIPAGTRDLQGTVATTRWHVKPGSSTECFDGEGLLPPRISPGDPVLVTGPDGQLLGKGALGEPDKVIPNDLAVPSQCRFPFTITDVPDDLDLCQVALGSDPDRVVVFTRSDLEADNWSVSLTLN